MGFSLDILPPGTAESLTMEEDDDREEGEIVDDREENFLELEDISSDEEFNLRKRIEELEAKNLELEKIANICYSNNTEYSKKDLGYAPDRYQNVAPDILPHIENFHSKRPKKNLLPLPPPPKLPAAPKRSTKLHHRTRRRTTSIKSINHDFCAIKDRSKVRKHRHEKISRSRSKKNERLKRRAIKSMVKDVSSSEDELCALDRETLRMALKRDVRSPNLKGNLQVSTIKREKSVEIVENHVPVIDLVKEEFDETKEEIAKDDDSDESVTLEEQELRLIALKSAVVKKHMARKKRKESDARKPYSPTDDFEQMMVVGMDSSSPHSLVDTNMDISPVESPDFFVEDRSLKPVDMDLVDSNDSASPIFVGNRNVWSPIEKISFPNGHSGPMVVPIAPIPIRDHMPSNYLCDANQQNVDNNRGYEEDLVEIKSSKISSPEPTDEEEEALRALLLAKLNSPRLRKSPKNGAKGENCLDTTMKSDTMCKINPNQENQENEQIQPMKDLAGIERDTSLDTEALRSFLLQSMKKKNAKKTELVLKEAVKRLQKRASPNICVNHDISSNDDDLSVNTNNSNVISNLNLEVSKDVECMMNVLQNVNISENSIVVSNPMVVFQPLCRPPIHNVHKTKKTVNPVLITIPLSNHNSVQPITNYSEVQAKPIEKMQRKLVKNDAISKPIEQINTAAGDLAVTVLPPITKANHSTVLPTIANSAPKAFKTARKIINKTIQTSPMLQLKRKPPTPISDFVKLYEKRTKLTLSAAPKTASSKSVTAFTAIGRPMKPIIIHVGRSESDSSDDEYFNSIPPQDQNSNGIDREYFDNASPKGLQMDSPCISPIPNPLLNATMQANQSTAVCDNKENQEQTEVDPKPTTVTIINDNFQVRLDELLKSARNRAEAMKKETSTVVGSSPKTPSAVCHLAPSSQLEYRMLVNRMKLLERQKQARSAKLISNNSQIKITIQNDQIGDPKPNLDIETDVQKSVANPAVIQLQGVPLKPESSEHSLLKQVLKKTVVKCIVVEKSPEVNEPKKSADEASESLATKSKSSESQEPEAQIKVTMDLPVIPTTVEIQSPAKNDAKKIIDVEEKLKLLASYEADFETSSYSLLESMDKTLELVTVAKNEKIKKIRLENQIEKTKKLLNFFENQLSAQRTKIGKIYPEILSSHTKITVLKAKCAKLDKLTSELGKSLKGKGYKSNTNSKAAILKKSKQLSTEINKLKGLKEDSKSYMNASEKLEGNKSKISPEKKPVESEKMASIDKSNNLHVEVSKESVAISPEDETQAQSDAVNPEVDLNLTNDTSIIEKVEEDKLEVDNSQNTPMYVTKIQSNTSEGHKNSEMIESGEILKADDANFSDSKTVESTVSAELPEIHEGQLEMTSDSKSDEIIVPDDEIAVELTESPGKTRDKSPETEKFTTERAFKTERTPLSERSDVSQVQKQLTDLNESSFKCETNDLPLQISNGSTSLNTVEICFQESIPIPPKTCQSLDVSIVGCAQSENSASVGKYISPLDHSSSERAINPNGVICPYQLRGQCDDKECKFEHLPSEG